MVRVTTIPTTLEAASQGPEKGMRVSLGALIFSILARPRFVRVEKTPSSTHLVDSPLDVCRRAVGGSRPSPLVPMNPPLDHSALDSGGD